MYNNWVLNIILVFLISGAAACRPFAAPTRAVPDENVPKTFSLYKDAPKADDRWWEGFDAPELNRLVETALSGNFTLKQAWARLRQSRALAVQAGAGRYPDLTFNADAATGRGKTGFSTESSRIEDVSLGLVSSYEVDLWGRVRASQAAAEWQAAASGEDLQTAAMSLAAEVADRWIRVIASRMEKDLLEKQWQTNKTLLELVELRFHNAMASALDVYQQKQITQNVKAQIPLAEESEQLLLHELAALLGKPPLAPLAIQSGSLPGLAPLPATGLPADVLAARPDVRAAGSRVRVAEHRLEAARADRLPALRLTALAQTGDGEMALLFENWLVRLAGNLSAPLFDGGQRAAEVDRNRAVVDETLAAYSDTVLNAIKEVEDALLQETRKDEHIRELEQVLATSRQALAEAGNRYRNGLNDYLPVLTQLLTVQGLERDLIQKKAGLLRIRIQLHRALGGAWADPASLPHARIPSPGETDEG